MSAPSKTAIIELLRQPSPLEIMRDNVPSATANIVAKNVVLVANTRGFSELVPREAARLSSQFVADFSQRGRSFVERSSSGWFQALRRVYERLTIPGLALHQALRKRHIEQQVRAALDEGFDQLVVLGGGLDSLCLRLSSEFGEANFLELDHPATQTLKLRAIESERLAGRNLELLPVDFTKQDLEEALNACHEYDRKRKTIFLAEGLLMYLSECEVLRVFDFVRRQSCEAKRFVFTFMETYGKGRANFRHTTWLARLWLKLKGEPFKWGLDAKDAESFLVARGFRLRGIATSATLRETYLRDKGLEDAVLAEGENICVCDAVS